MKRIVLALLLGVFLIGCATPAIKTIEQAEDKWGPPAEVEHRTDNTSYYWFYKKARVSGGWDWAVLEIITDNEGNVLKMRKYWVQPTYPAQ